MNATDKKIFEYASKINEAIAELFSEDSDMHIKDLGEDDNLTLFIHAMATVAPCSIANKITGQEMNQLEFNNDANTLIFQYAKQADKEDTDNP